MENETPLAWVHTQPTPIATTPARAAAASTAKGSGNAGMQQQVAAGIGAEPIGRRVTEADQPRVADHQIEAHGEQPKDQRLGQQCHREQG